MVKAATAERLAKTHIDSLAGDVGQRIRAARLERGMSLADLGGEDLSRSFLSLVELGRSRISLRALALVADRLQLPISYFLDETAGSRESATELSLDLAEAALLRDDAEEALRILDGLAIPELQRARERWLRGRALIESGKPRDAISVLREGLTMAERRGDGPLVTKLCYQLGMALYNARNYDESLVSLRRALDEAMKIGDDPVLTGKITVAMGHNHYMRGDIEDAIECYARARELFSSLADLNTLACVYSGLSRAYQSKGDLSSALRYSKLSVAAFEANHNGRGAANELNGMAVRYQELGDLQHALECGQDAVERARQVNARDLEALAHSTLAAIHLKLEDVGTAAAEAQVAEALSPEETDLARIDAWLVLAEIAERESDSARADELYQKALSALQQRGWQSAYAEAALSYSLLLRRRGETSRALEYALEAAQARPAQSA